MTSGASSAPAGLFAGAHRGKNATNDLPTMATHAATRNISGLARALAQHGVMSEAEAEALQTQSQASGVPLLEQVLSGKRLSAQQLAVFASRAFGVPLLDLAGFDADQLRKDKLA